MPFVRVLLLAFSIPLACFNAPAPVSPFTVPPKIFFDSVHTIVVTSAVVVGEIRIADSVLTHFETLIEEELREAGLSVVPASEHASIWQRISDEAGGFFDLYTGERDEEKFQVAAERLRNEILERFEPDALLYPEIWEVEAPFSGGQASWSGITQMVSGGRGYSGDVRAATLFVAIQDTAGNELYVQEAGIQVLEFLLRGQLTPLSDQLLFDSPWISAVVSRALAPLIEGRSGVTPKS